MSKSNHPIEQEELMQYLDGELATDRAIATVAHLERCHECQRLAADLRQVSQKLMAWQVESLDPAKVRGVAVALDDRDQRPSGVFSESPSIVNRRNWRELLRLPRLSPAWVGGLGIAALVLVVISTTTLVRQKATFGAFSKANHAVDRNGPLDEFEQRKQPAAPQQGMGDRDRLSESKTGIVNGALDRGVGTVGKYQQQVAIDGALVSDQISPIPNGPMIVRTAGLTLITKQFDKVRSAIEDILRRHHGYIGDLNVAEPVGSGRTLNATLRVPADQLEATISELKKLGRVEQESQSGQEVTAQYVDLQARLANARNTEQRLTDLLRQRTGKLSDVLAAEVEIARVRGEIEQMEAARKTMATQVDFATLNAIVTDDYKAELQVVPFSMSTRFRNAAVEGYRTMVEGIVGAVVLLFAYLPSLLLWAGLLFFPVRSVWKRLRRSPAQ